jgi:hypothetical protein
MWWSSQDIHVQQPSPDLVKGLTWYDSLQVWWQQPVWGIGRGAFGEAFTAHQHFFTSQWVSQPEHLIILNLTEGGVWGGVSLCVFTLIGWRWFTTPQLNAHPLALSMGLGLTGVVLHQGFDFGLESLGVSIPCAVVWGLMWSYKPSHLASQNHAKARDATGRRSHQRERKKRDQRIWFSAQIGSGALLLVILIGMLVYQSPHLLRSSINRLDQTITTKRELLDAVSVHPISAHHALRMAQHDTYSPQIQSAWINQARRLAPQWSGPLLLQARSLAQREFDELAALYYMRVLSLDVRQRSVVFKDVALQPLSLPITDWLPTRYWLSYYKFLSTQDRQRALGFLLQLQSKHLSMHSDIRAVWLRQALHLCPTTKLTKLSKQLRQKIEDASKRGLDLVPSSLLSLPTEVAIDFVDLSLIERVNLICRSPRNIFSQREQRLELRDRMTLIRGIQVDARLDSAFIKRGDVLQRKSIADSILKKSFKNRSITTIEVGDE